MATDIAFAVGVIVALGNRIPLALRALLLAIAVIDDLGAIIVIAFFYSKGVAPLWIVGFLVAAFLNWALNKKGKWSWSIHIFLGLIAWGCMLFSGVHATLAGVIWGLLTPDDKSDHAPLDMATHKLHPYVSFGVLPLFALANSGLKLPSTADLLATLNDSLLWAIGIGLLVGKPIGIALSSWICIKSKMGELPIGVSFRHIWGIGFLAGIGFTMSLFIAQLSLPNEELLNSAKIGILAGSIFAGLFGFIILFFSKSRIRSG